MRFIALDFRISMHYNGLSRNNGEMSNNSLKNNGLLSIIVHYLRKMHEMSCIIMSLDPLSFKNNGEKCPLFYIIGYMGRCFVEI